MTLLPYLAFAVSESFATCMKSPKLGVVLAGITFLIIIGYGNFLAIKNPEATNATFWISSIVFYAASSGLVAFLYSDDLFGTLMTKLTYFYDAFIWQYQPNRALDAVGGLSFVALVIWMPIAFILSMIVFADVLHKRRLDVAAPI